MAKTCEMTYKMVASPLGELELSGCRQGLHGIRLLERKTPDAGPTEAPGAGDTAKPLVQCAAWLDAYFHEPSALPELPVPALHHPVFQQDSFTRQVLWTLLKAVRFGDVVTYQQLAALAGSPKAARAVGGAMRSNPVPILIPCHRVVLSTGAIGNYSGGAAIKRWLLAHEGSQAWKPATEGAPVQPEAPASQQN
ncbi:methylated-DNA--protein-cysteine methyltransferase isoform 1-T6 [Hipposideros larvatus]